MTGENPVDDHRDDAVVETDDPRKDVLARPELADEVPPQLVPHAPGLVSGCLQLADGSGSVRCHERRLVRVRAIA